MKKSISLACCFFALALLVAAPADTSTSLNVVVAFPIEAKATLTQSFTFPVLRGDSPLTSGNNLKLSVAAELSPVSVNGVFGVTVTPIAFLKFSAAAFIGSGWNIPIANGIKLNKRSFPDITKNELTGDSFSGLVWGGKAGGTFQFDFAAVFPGDWNHVVIQSYQGLMYRANTAAAAEDSWVYEGDAGENRNGFSYSGNLFLGYQMPIVLSMTGVLCEFDKFLYGTPGSEKWGENLGRYTIAPMVNFDVNKNFSIAFLSQFRTRRRWTLLTQNLGFYQDRRVDTDKPLEFYFLRAVINATWKLK